MRYLILFILFWSFSVEARHIHPEKFYQENYCDGVLEHRLDDGTRVDCLTDELAVEFDFANKWAEAIGQALYYAKKTGKKPAVFLIVENKNQWKYIERVYSLCKEYGIVFMVYVRI